MNPDTLRDIETLRSRIEACGPRKMVFFEATDEAIDEFIEQVHTYLTTEGA